MHYTDARSRTMHVRQMRAALVCSHRFLHPYKYTLTGSVRARVAVAVVVVVKVCLTLSGFRACSCLHYVALRCTLAR